MEKEFFDSNKKDLVSLVDILSQKGVSLERIRRSADRCRLDDCSYGSRPFVNPAIGLLGGTILGFCAASLSDSLCYDNSIEGLDKGIIDGAAFISTFVGIFMTSYLLKEYKDWQFYCRLQEVFKNKLRD